MGTATQPTARNEPSGQDICRAALQAFFGITEDWKASVEQQRLLLGSPPASTFFKIKKSRSGRLSVDTLDRISYIMGIHKSLSILLGDTARVRRWIHAPNEAPLFGGRSALEFMSSGRMEDLAAVRHFLDAERGH